MATHRNGRKEGSSAVSIGGVGISFLPGPALPCPEFESVGFPLPKQAGEKLCLRVHRGPPPFMKATETIFDSGETWAFFKWAGKLILQNDAMQRGSAPDRFVVLEPDLRSGEIYLVGGPPEDKVVPDPLGYPLNQILMILLLSRGAGLLVHACGVDDHGAGYLFLGNSTHGKSTMASLWFHNHATILNDDRVIVREKDGVFWMYGTPWHGDFRPFSTEGLPISKIFFLRHGETNSVTPKKGAEAVSMILARSFPPLWDKRGMDHAMELCHGLAKKTPSFELHFKPDGGIVDFVRHLEGDDG